MFNYSVILNKNFNLLLNQLHTSAVLNSNRDDELIKIEELLDSEKNNSPDSINTDPTKTEPTVEDLKKGLAEFKKEISKIRNEELKREIEDVQEFINENKDSISNIDEAFSNYSNYAVKKKLIEGDETHMTNVLESLANVLDECKKKGIESDCLKQINVSGIIEKGLIESKKENLPTSLINKISRDVFDVLNTVGDMTLKELYFKYNKLNLRR
jgi:hypothetical protein